MKPPPVILCIGGHDPTGGAGIQADIETVTALGARALTLVTALTAQDTRDIVEITPTPIDAFTRQLQTLQRDIRPDAIKIGLLASPALLDPLTSLLDGFAGPVVIDPVLAAGGGFDLADRALIDAVRGRLLPHATLLTPNRHEARRLTGLENPEQAAHALLDGGTGAILLTGADEAQGDSVHNRLYHRGMQRSFAWPRLPHQYHGSGCTLASACAARLALGDDLETAVATAQAFTWKALAGADRPGNGQWLPVRRI